MTAPATDDDLARTYDRAFDEAVTFGNIIDAHHAGVRAVQERAFQDAVFAAGIAFAELGVSAESVAHEMQQALAALQPDQNKETLL